MAEKLVKHCREPKLNTYSRKRPHRHESLFPLNSTLWLIQRLHGIAHIRLPFCLLLGKTVDDGSTRGRDRWVHGRRR